jgi:BON domain-containing protein
MRNAAQQGKRLLFIASLFLPIASVGCGSSQYALRQANDRTISARVVEHLAAAPELSSVKIHARSHSGVVALVGEVGDESERLAAGKIAGAVDGVTRVDNLIVVVKGDSRAAGSAPAAAALNMTRTD